ncbi:MAG: type I-U CRISPR-associated protein Csx17 [Lacunisphaera sp.]|nr:type I-U CRISPR-associated protein Csx17 [Lacunisphaera sp.]
MHDHPLSGCAPTPLAHYLKALGILRLVSEDSEHGDPTAAGYWQRDTFHLRTKLDRPALLDFFLHHYRPTPIIAPWNGGSGFFPKDNDEALQAILASTHSRFIRLRETLSTAETLLHELGLKEKPDSPAAKSELLLHCRNRLPDAALPWLDATYILAADGPLYPPLLGTGGNDGRLDFTNNFQQRLLDVLSPDNGEPTDNSAPWLALALFGENCPGLSNRAIGQFSPSAAGGANSANGVDAPASVNPWDFVLMLEGTALYASAAVKRLETTEPGQLSYPFCVRSTGAGYASDSAGDEQDARAELWLPLWPAAAPLSDIRALFSEGRALVGRRAARDAIEFTRAIVSLGVDRGVAEFQRFGFLLRNGLAYFATPLDRVPVRRDAEAADLLDDIGPWLDSFRRAARGDRAPSRIAAACRNLERAIFALCNRGAVGQRSDPAILAVLTRLGACEAALAASLRWTTDQPRLSPLQLTHSAWLRAALAAAPHETALAQALASLTLPRFRSHLEPVDAAGFRWDDQAADVTWIHGRPLDALLATLQRRLVLAEVSGNNPLRGGVPAPLPSITRLIEGRLDEALFESLLLALVCLRPESLGEFARLPANSPDDPVPSALFALLRAALAGDLPGCSDPIPRVPAILRRAATGDGREATRLAARRLRASGLAPAFDHIDQRGDTVRRTAAALLFPLSPRSLGELLQLIQPSQS